MQGLKKELRGAYIARRRSMEKNLRENLDEKIYNNIIESGLIRDCDTVLAYASSAIEVDTRRLIETALKAGKIVGVPKCEGKNMRFLRINSLSELIVGAYGVDEPSGGEEITRFENSVCITPGLSFDENGYRLGYGGGFYDRFLRNYIGISVGVCYADFCGKVPTDELDIPVDTVITENGFLYRKEDFCGRKRV